jgi:capsid protein
MKKKPEIKQFTASQMRNATRRASQHALIEGKRMMRNSGGYPDAGDVGRVRSDWSAQLITSTAFLRRSFKTIVARCEDARRGNPYAVRAVDFLKTYVVGGGIRPFPAAVDVNGNPMDSVNAVLARDWPRANDEIYRINSQPITAMEAQGIEFFTMMTDGSWLRQEISSKKGKSLLPRAFTVLSPTHLDFSRDTFENPYKLVDYTASSGQTILGQVMNPFFEPIGFNLDTYEGMFPASAMSIHFRTIEAEQRLGVPWLAPVVPWLWDIRSLFDDKILQSRLLTRYGVWEKKSAKKAMSKILNTEIDDGDESAELDKLSTYYSDEKPEPIQFDDTISNSLHPLMKMALHAIAVGLGFSYGRLTTDLEGANFAGGRINLITDAKVFNSLFRHFVKSSCQSVWDKFVEWEALTGRISMTDYLVNKWGFSQCYHLPEAEQWVDPLKDAQAQDLLYKTGQITLQQLCAMQGTNYLSIITQRAKEKKELIAAGLKELLPINDSAAGTAQQSNNQTGGTNGDENA